MKGAFGNEGALPLIAMQDASGQSWRLLAKYDKSSGFFASVPRYAIETAHYCRGVAS
jgi:hypothetical protein